VRAFGGFALILFGLIALVLLVETGLLGTGKVGVLLMPLLGSLLSISVLPQRYRVVLVERDTWVIMLVYSITVGAVEVR
jgi:MFS transporter, NNP family, nitrate/nitrite transporter